MTGARSELQRAGEGAGERIRLMKVLTTYTKGGTEGQVLNLVRSLAGQPFDILSACLKKGGDLLPEFERLAHPITEFRIRRLYHPQTFLQQLRFANHLRAQRVQVMHSYNFYANTFAVPAARIAGTPVVLASIRDRGVYLSPAQMRVQKWACELADRILVNADSIRDWLLEQGYTAEKIVVIKNGVDLSQFADRQHGSELRRELGIPESAPIVAMIARLNPKKGFDEFIRAAALIHRSHPEVRFLVVGTLLTLTADGKFRDDHSYRDELIALAEQLGIAHRIIFAGYRQDIPQVLAETAVSVLPSYSEGLSNSLLESLAAGVPTVATDVGGNSELISDGVNGLLIPVRTVEPLADACRRILDEPELARRMSDNARALAHAEFSLARMAADTAALYRAELRRARCATGPEKPLMFSRFLPSQR